MQAETPSLQAIRREGLLVRSPEIGDVTRVTIGQFPFKMAQAPSKHYFRKCTNARNDELKD
jgi:hypothetical protein